MSGDELELYLQYTETREGGEPDGNGPYASHSDENITFTPEACYRDRAMMTDWHCETLAVPEDVHKAVAAFLVIVRYEDGNTFGRSFGNWQIDGIYSSPVEAKQIFDQINSDEQSHGNLGRGYTPWKSYFARFECAQLKAVPIY